MDAPAWDSGWPPAASSNAPSASFVVFFPTTSESDRQAPSETRNVSGPNNSVMSWGTTFAPTRPITRPPAWHRVASEANSSTNAARIIMKRVNLPARRNCQGHFFSEKAKETAAADLLRAWTKIEKCEMSESKARRTSSYRQTDAENRVCGMPQSMAEMASAILQAKVDIANGILATPLTALAEEVKRLRSRTHHSTIPMKRRIDRYIRLGESGMLGGYRLRTYGEILPILRKATDKGDKKVDVLSASIAEASAGLRDLRQDPRRRITLQGIPELSDIQDVTEPGSSLTLARPDSESFEPAKSPTKRMTSPVQPVKPSPGRLSSSTVKLLPAGSPCVEPSPTKTSSVPPTPLQETPSRVKLVQTPSPLRQVPYAAPGPSPSPFKLSSVSPGPTKIFKAPSYVDASSSSLLQSVGKSSPVQESPSKISRPFAPTPSRWTRTETTTPLRSMPPPSQPSSAAQGSSELGLVASIPPSTPQLQPRARTSSMSLRMSEISFGTFSPTFSSASWLGHVDARPRRNIKKSMRRKSEPLIRSCFASQTARRQSVSPRKLVFQGDYIFRHGGASNTATPATGRTVRFDDVDEADGISNQTPEQPSSSEVTLNMTTPAISWGRMTGRLSDEGVHETPTLNPAEANSVHNVDMRQNPDIFGAPASSPKHKSPSSISHLAEIAEEHCDGQANIFVTQEYGRLIVRFKLPIEYAHMFPDDQGADESNFTMTPSAISSSPRISFDQITTAEACEQTSDGGPIISSPLGNEEQTLVVPDFATSPVGLKSDSTLDYKPGDNQQDTNVSGNLTMSVADPESSGKRKPALDPDSNNLPTRPNGPVQADPVESNPETDSDSPLSDIDHTPTISELGLMGATASVIQNEVQTPSKKPGEDKEIVSAAKTTTSPPQATTPKLAISVPGPAANTTPTLNNSFTPVNQSCSRNRRTSGKGSAKSDRLLPVDESKVELAAQEEHEPQQTTQYDDSPGRDYMRDFIKRTSRKRMSTTDAGSPIAVPVKRVPLGIKSPNTESPQKNKRKLEARKNNSESPLKKGTERAPKKARRMDNTSPRKKTPKTQNKGSTEINATRETVDSEAALRAVANGDEQEDAAEADSAPGARRSTRIRSQSEPTTTAKSSIPTAIKLGGRPGAGRGGLASAARSEQQDLSYQTRMNTRKNKGNAEYPVQVLARPQTQAQREGSSEEATSSGSDTSANPFKSRKNVCWKTPLESHQEQVEEPKKARVGFAKSRITYGSSGITKPSKNGSVQKQQRTAKVAATLGMSQNGTPAKARVTRSSARVRT